MKYVEFKSLMKNFIVFTHRDIRLIDPNFDLNILSDWQKKQYIQKVRKGYYIFSDLKLEDHFLYHISNKIYSPSYISFELALSNYGLIPETVYGKTAATSRKTMEFSTPVGSFYYKHLKPKLMFGYRVDTLHNVKVKMAKIEKAVLDYFYIYSDLKTKKDFDNVRFDYNYFIQQANEKLLYEYLEKYTNKALEERIGNLLRSAKDA